MWNQSKRTNIECLYVKSLVFVEKNLIFPEDSSRLEQVLNFLMRAESFLGDAVKAVSSG